MGDIEQFESSNFLLLTLSIILFLIKVLKLLYSFLNTWSIKKTADIPPINVPVMNKKNLFLIVFYKSDLSSHF